MRTARQLVEDAADLYSKGDAEGYCALYSDDAVVTSPDGRFEGQAALLSYVQGLMSPWPGAAVTVGRHCEQAGLYFGEFTLRGTNDGPLLMPDGTESPATHKSVEVRGVEIVRVDNGKVVQHDYFWDNLSLLAQLELLPQT